MKKVGKYEVDRTIGEGTFAINFARIMETSESVFIKILAKFTILMHKMVNRDYVKRQTCFVSWYPAKAIVAAVQAVADTMAFKVHSETSSYKIAYALSIGPLPSKDQWEEVEKNYKIGPPHAKRLRGRPKKKRIRGHDEISSDKVSKRVHKCTRCHGWGHHKNTCKQPINLRPLSNADAEAATSEPEGNQNASGSQRSASHNSKLQSVRGKGGMGVSGRLGLVRGASAGGASAGGASAREGSFRGGARPSRGASFRGVARDSLAMGGRGGSSNTFSGRGRPTMGVGGGAASSFSASASASTIGSMQMQPEGLVHLRRPRGVVRKIPASAF